MRTMIGAPARWARLFLRRVYYSVRFAGTRIEVDASAWVSRRSVIRTNGGGRIRIGAHCEIHDFAVLMTYGGNITLGPRTSVNPFSVVYGHGGTTIGTGVRIAAHVTIIPANHVRGSEELPVHASGLTARGISIGDHVWLGSGVRILDGVTIGNHVVVGAGAVVNKSLPSHSLAVGVPARVVQPR
jgi:acetyltransferase-like isoleucine patch superfamily enzyme